MKTKVDVILTPAEWAALTCEQLNTSTCVVFDVLRATSTIVTALNSNAKEVIVVRSIEEALAYRSKHPDVILAGERNGRRIRASETGTIDFDLGNSPREFTPKLVSGKTVVMTTTNGTNAIQACDGAVRIFAGSMLNLTITAQTVQNICSERLLLVCAGTGKAVSYEDTLAAGAFLQTLKNAGFDTNSDACAIALELYRTTGGNLQQAFASTTNGRRLSKDAELREDVSFCAQRDVFQEVVYVEGNHARVMNRS